MPSARPNSAIMAWLKGKITTISIVVAAVALFVGNVDTIFSTVGGWFEPDKESTQTIIIQVTKESLIESARQLEQSSAATQGRESAEAAEAAKDLTNAAQALPQPIAIDESAQTQPPWLKIAMAEIGQQEVAGDQKNPRIIEYIRSAVPSLAEQGEELPWSSFFVNWVMTQAGIKGTNSGLARSWLEWGVPLEQPRLGAIVVFSRGGNPQSGHPGFFLSEAGDYILCVSGNVSNAVRIGAMPKERLLGYRWPAGS